MHSPAPSLLALLALVLAETGCKGDSRDVQLDESSTSTSDEPASDEATSGSEDSSDAESSTTNFDTTTTAGASDTTDTGAGGDALYEESFVGPDGAPWPAPWRVVGSHVLAAEIDENRGRMSGENNLTARIVLDGFDVADVDVLVTVEYEDWTRQGYGFYARQNGGALLETDPPGAGYGVFAEGGNSRTLGLWKEVAGAEMPILEVPVEDSVQAGVPYTIRFQCEQNGDVTSLRAKMWRVGDDEPERWHVEAEDGTPELQHVGGSFASDVYNYAGTGSVWVHDIVIDER